MFAAGEGVILRVKQSSVARQDRLQSFNRHFLTSVYIIVDAEVLFVLPELILGVLKQSLAYKVPKFVCLKVKSFSNFRNAKG